MESVQTSSSRPRSRTSAKSLTKDTDVTTNLIQWGQLDELQWLQCGLDQGPIFLWIHGFPDTAWIWQNQLEHFSNLGLHVAPFLPGLPPRAIAPHQQIYNPEWFVQAIITMLDELDPKRRRPVHLIGHDIGSMFAWILSQRLDERVKNLIIINGAHPQIFMKQLLRNHKQRRKSWYMGLFMMPHVPELLVKSCPRILKRHCLRKLGHPWPTQRIGDEHALDHSHQLIRHYRGLAQWAWRHSRQPSTQPLSIPVLQIACAEDPFLEVPQWGDWESIAPQMTLRVIHGDHWPQVKQPQRINELIENHLLHHWPDLQVRHTLPLSKGRPLRSKSRGRTL